MANPNFLPLAMGYEDFETRLGMHEADLRDLSSVEPQNLQQRLIAQARIIDAETHISDLQDGYPDHFDRYLREQAQVQNV